MKAAALSVAAAFACANAAQAEGARKAADPFDGDRLFHDVEVYDSLGEHRTATATDYLTHAWLAVRLKALGFHVELVPFTTRQFHPTETSVTVGDKRVEAFPVWHPTPTRLAGVSAKLSSNIDDVAGKIYLFDNTSGTITQAVQRTILKAAANGAVGVIDVLTATASPVPEIYGQNAQQQVSYAPGADPGDGDQTPWPVPVVTVARKDRPTLQTALDGAQAVKLRSLGITQDKATSYVLTGSLDRGPVEKTLIVSTPASGWFHNAAERGTGVAAWLALAEWAARETTGVRWLFVSSSGHELNFRGTNHYLQSDVIPPPEDVYLWTHLGANLVTYAYTQNADGTLTRTDQPAAQAIKYVASNPALVGAFSASFVPANNPEAKALNITGLQNAIGGGDLFYAKYYGYDQLLYFAGANPYFHTRLDTPDVTGPALLEPFARLIKTTFERIIAEIK